MSGLAKPSCVVPALDHDAATSSSRPLVPMSSSAPTLMTYGSLPGACDTASPAAPRLPAAATTTRPANQADSAAASSGSVAADCVSVDSSDRLTTRML